MIMAAQPDYEIEDTQKLEIFNKICKGIDQSAQNLQVDLCVYVVHIGNLKLS